MPAPPVRPARQISVVIAVALALLWALGGCRRPDPVYGRFPRPLATRDLVRAERRAGPPLSVAERAALESVHDRYLAAFEDIRTSEMIPFAATLAESGRQTNSDPFADPKELRRRVGRHASIIAHVAALDADFLSDAETTLGTHRADTIASLRDRRALDRANVLSVSDGGRVLLDLSTLLERLKLDDDVTALIAPELASHAAQAAQLAQRIAHDQMYLSTRYLDVLVRKGEPEDLVAPSLEGEARENALNRLRQERYAETRRPLERLLTQFADQADATIARIAPKLPEEDAERLERRMLRARIDDEPGRAIDDAAFEALVASRADAVPAAERTKISALREKFLAEDAERLRALVAIRRESKVPGVIEPGGREAGQARKARREAIDRERATAAPRFREAFLPLVPEALRGKLLELHDRNRIEIADSLAELVGAGRVSALLAKKPRGFADGDPPEQADDSGAERDSDGGGMRALLPPAPSERDLRRLLARANVDQVTRDVVRDIAVAWRERWDEAREAVGKRGQQLMNDVGAAFSAQDADNADRAIGLFLRLVDEVRQQRAALDLEFVSDAEIASPLVRGPATELWLWERAELTSRLQFDQLPGQEMLVIAPESAIRFFDVLAETELLGDALAIAADALRPIMEELNAAAEAQRNDMLAAIRVILGMGIRARSEGIREDEAMVRSADVVRRGAAPLRASSRRLAELHADALERVAATMPDADARALRERYIQAAYPGVLNDRRAADPALEAMLEDDALDAGQREAVRKILELRSVARAAAAAKLLLWGRENEVSATNLGDRDALTRTYPAVAAVTFAREEADARALRASMGELRPEQLDRHRDLAAWFEDPPMSMRGYD
ncbi:MAG: hypothetical protein SGJ09_18275 [Phycisphaerae bacterium]|nr:hypothetical protein [Phycisphaerae bacterium]